MLSVPSSVCESCQPKRISLPMFLISRPIPPFPRYVLVFVGDGPDRSDGFYQPFFLLSSA